MGSHTGRANVLPRFLSAARNEARQHGLSGTNADDFVSAFLLGCLQAPPDSTVSYTLACGRNAARRFIRQQGRNAPVVVTDIDTVAADTVLDPCALALRDELRSLFEAAAAQLTPQQQTLWQLCCLEGKNAAEAAEVVGRSHAAVRQSLLTLRTRMRTLLAAEGLNAETVTEYLPYLQKRSE